MTPELNEAKVQLVGAIDEALGYITDPQGFIADGLTTRLHSRIKDVIDAARAEGAEKAYPLGYVHGSRKAFGDCMEVLEWHRDASTEQIIELMTDGAAGPSGGGPPAQGPQLESAPLTDCPEGGATP